MGDERARNGLLLLILVLFAIGLVRAVDAIAHWATALPQ